MSRYEQRGVSAQKEEVHAAIAGIDQGLYKNAFCKVYPDSLGGDDNWVNIMHADGAGTKTALAYLYWKETGDNTIWKGIAQDAVAMNLDDLLCIGVTDNLLFSSTIDRNKKRIPGEVLKAVIDGTQEFFEMLAGHGIRVHYLGGETADVGDVVRTIAVNGTMTARWPKQQLITNERIAPGDVIVGFASFGKANYESFYNSGIGSNGLTSARHDMLNKHYAQHFPESFENSLAEEVVYSGPYRLQDSPDGLGQTVGEALLSPTRTYAPLVKEMLHRHFSAIHGMVHCSGGGQTKCLKYLPRPMRVVKDHLFEPPPVFDLIARASGADPREMYQVFNMGHRLEVFASEQTAGELIALGVEMGLNAQVVGRVEDAPHKCLDIRLKQTSLSFL